MLLDSLNLGNHQVRCISRLESRTDTSFDELLNTNTDIKGISFKGFRGFSLLKSREWQTFG